MAVKPEITRPANLSVRRADSGIDDVSLHAGAGCVEVVVSIERKISLIDSIESPRGACLSCIRG